MLRDGRWDAAAAAAGVGRVGDGRPWVVLVTGVNGIRKTSALYEPWFKEVLQQALGDRYIGDRTALPAGDNSFFRQLDFIIATIANEEFRLLYEVDDVREYAALKDGIFARYRTVAEMAGILLLEHAKKLRLNVLAETSGRDIGMFRYVDHFFPDADYRKLAIHFTVNDVAFAEASVDARMTKEMRDGRRALERASAAALIDANAGGPYGSAVLREVQDSSEAVWAQVLGGAVSDAWTMATLAVDARTDGAWTVRAKAFSPFAYTPRGQ